MFQTKREMQETINSQAETIGNLKKANEQLQEALTALDGVGHCVSNMCLYCRYALTIGDGFSKRPYACFKERVCSDYEPT